MKKEKTKYACQNCGWTETLEIAPMCPKCSWDFMGLGRIGFEMKPVDNKSG